MHMDQVCFPHTEPSLKTDWILDVFTFSKFQVLAMADCNVRAFLQKLPSLLRQADRHVHSENLNMFNTAHKTPAGIHLCCCARHFAVLYDAMK